jgi:hypothetical protein
MEGRPMEFDDLGRSIAGLEMKTIYILGDDPVELV